MIDDEFNIPQKEEVTSFSVSGTDAFMATLDRTVMDIPINHAIRFGQQTVLKMMDDDIISPKELNKRYNMAELGAKPFNEPVKAAVAQFAYDAAKQKKDLDDTIAMGPQSFAAKSGRAVGMLIPHMMDPVNLATGAIASQMMIARGIMAGGGAGMAVARSATENLAGNLATEPLAMIQERNEQANYGAIEFGANLVVGTIAGTGLEFGLKGIAKGYHVGRSEFRTRAAKEAALNLAMKQVSEGKKVDVGAVKRSVENDVKPSDLAPRYEFRPITSEEIPTRTFFAATDTTRYEFNDAETLDFGDDLGPGMHLTDDPVRANNHAGSRYNDEPGQVFEVDLSQARVWDPAGGPPPGVRKDFKALVKETETSDPVAALRAAMRDPELRPQAEAILKKLEERGFDGLRTSDEKNPHNGIFLFNKTKTKHKAAKAPDPKWLNNPKDEVRSALEADNKVERNQGYDPEAARSLEEPHMDTTADEIIEGVDTIYNETLPSGLISKEVADEIKAIEAMEKTLDEVGNKMIACLSRSA